ncbi:MAG: PCI domain-containing protein [Candidatus Thorarchaeota archaeon]
MPKKGKSNAISCKNCGESWSPTEVPTNKEWTKLAPMPDSEGRVTIMMMATWTCPGCGKNVMGLKGKYKDDGTSGPSKKELMMEMIEKADKKIAISEIAAELSLSVDNVEKALTAFIAQNSISGKIEGGYFIKK